MLVGGNFGKPKPPEKNKEIGFESESEKLIKMKNASVFDFLYL
jgi:hypothetical protein